MDKCTLFYYTCFILQVCPNGVIQFESERFNRWPYKFGQRYWLRYDPILAPYWSNIDLVNSFVTGPSKVFYQIYSDSMPGANTTLGMATADVMKLLTRPLPTNFSASWVLVVTWEKLRPRELTAASQSLVRYVKYYFERCNKMYDRYMKRYQVMFSVNGTNLLHVSQGLTDYLAHCLMNY